MAESDTDICRNSDCGHLKSQHTAYGDEYDFDYHDCEVAGCSCLQFIGEDDE